MEEVRIPEVLYNALGFQVSDMAEVELALPKKPKGITVYDMNGRKVVAQLLSYADGKARDVYKRQCYL